jgi:HK97 family phage major capsid protein
VALVKERLKKLLEQRAGLFAQARAAYDNATREGAEDTAEARSQFDAAMAQVRELDGQIAEVRELLASEHAAMEARAALGDLPGGGEPQGQGGGVVDKFRAFLAGNEGRSMDLPFDSETRGLNTGKAGATANSGEGNLMATTLVAALYVALKDTSIIRSLAASVTTTGGEDLEFPKLGNRPTASRVNQGATIPQSDPTFTKMALKAYKYAFIAKLTSEMVSDPAVNLVPFITAFGREALFDAQAADFMVGTGTNQPQGLIPGLTITRPAAAVNAITLDEVLALKFAVKQGYRANGVYVTNSATAFALAKLKDADGRYLWKVSAVAGEPDQLHGRPAFTDENVPSIGANARSLAFVDPGRAYLIRDVASVRVDRSEEFAWGSDEVAWRFIVRSDGGVWDQQAGAVLVHPAS